MCGVGTNVRGRDECEGERRMCRVGTNVRGRDECAG